MTARTALSIGATTAAYVVGLVGCRVRLGWVAEPTATAVHWPSLETLRLRDGGRRRSLSSLGVGFVGFWV